MRCFLFQHSVMANPTVFWALLRSNAYEFVHDFVHFPSGKKKRYRLSTHMLIFVVNIRPARTFWNSTHCLRSPFTLDWSRNLWQDPMWNMAVNKISYPIYPLSTRTEKGYITKMIPFFFFVQYTLVLMWNSHKNLHNAEKYLRCHCNQFSYFCPIFQFLWDENTIFSAFAIVILFPKNLVKYKPLLNYLTNG